MREKKRFSRKDAKHAKEAARRVLEGKITTEYALPVAGVYFIKGVSSISSDGDGGSFKPIKVVVNEPEGIDLEVWKQIKGNREIAYLLQKGTFDTEEEAKKEELSNQVEQIFTQFPNSVYSIYLKPNLEKYKAHQIVLKESMERAVVKPKN